MNIVVEIVESFKLEME